jgi:3-hydroxyacyl-CoA dehydrogenase
LWDQDPQAPVKAWDYVAGLLPDQEANDPLNGAAPATIRARMHPASSLEEVVVGASYVQANTPENVEVKRTVFAQLDSAAAPDTSLASSTSAILPSAFTEPRKGRGRSLVVQPINSPYLILAAEIVPAAWTEPVTAERAAELLRGAGHTPIVMKGEIDGLRDVRWPPRDPQPAKRGSGSPRAPSPRMAKTPPASRSFGVAPFTARAIAVT